MIVVLSSEHFWGIYIPFEEEIYCFGSLNRSKNKGKQRWGWQKVLKFSGGAERRPKDYKTINCGFRKTYYVFCRPKGGKNFRQKLTLAKPSLKKIMIANNDINAWSSDHFGGIYVPFEEEIACFGSLNRSKNKGKQR